MLNQYISIIFRIKQLSGKRLIGISANTIKPINNFVWGIFNYGEDIVESLDDLKTLLDKEFGAS